MTDQPVQSGEESSPDDLVAEVALLRRRLSLAHQARREREHLLDGIRRALCDVGVMRDDDPYGHRDLADVIRQCLPTERPTGAAAATVQHRAGPDATWGALVAGIDRSLRSSPQAGQ